MAIAGLKRRTHGPSHGLQEMKIEEYRSILRAVEQAIQICDDSAKSMDKTHQDICAELRITRARLHQLICQDASTKTRMTRDDIAAVTPNPIHVRRTIDPSG